VGSAVGLPFIDKTKVSCVAFSSTGSALIHAAAFDERIKRIAVVDGLASYRQIVMNRAYQFDSSEMIGGVLTAYDLPDLVGVLAPRETLLLNPRGHDGKILTDDQSESTYRFSKKCYEDRSAASSLVIRSTKEEAEQILSDWLLE